ncbi:MAG: ABC-three component system middle component 2 [Pseudomonadota bacterium]
MTRQALQTFNGPIEAGIRLTAILLAAYPAAFDLQRLTAFDYLIGRTGQFENAPGDLYPPAPITTPPTEVRRKAASQALELLLSRNIAVRTATESGIEFSAGSAAEFFFTSLSTDYAFRLKNRADWLVAELAPLSSEEFNALMRSLFEKWAEEFQVARDGQGDAA